MTLPSSGTLQASDINVELGRAWNHFFDMNGAAERNLAGKPSGTISFSDFYGKSNLIREPATGERFTRFFDDWEQFDLGRVIIYWGSDIDIYDGYPGGASAVAVGTWTYYRGAHRGASTGRNYYGIYRIGKY